MESSSLWDLARDPGIHQKTSVTEADTISWSSPDLSNFALRNFATRKLERNFYFKIDNDSIANITLVTRVIPRLAPYPDWLIIVLWLLTTIFSIETILGNLLVLMAYKLERSIRRQLSNKFIVSLAVTDLIIGMEGFPLLTVYVVGRERWPLGRALCQIWLCLDYTLCLVSILTVLLITVDRYGSVCYPAKYRSWQTNTRVRMFVIFSWVVPCFFFGIMIFAWDPLTGHRMDDSGKCYAPFLNDPYVNMSMYIVYYWTTLVAVSVLYRGIHTAAKTLEDKSKARERQTIALLLGQRCMAQVGVGMLFHSTISDEYAHHELSFVPHGAGGGGIIGAGGGGTSGCGAGQRKEVTEAGHDSGYMTTTATVTTHTNISGGSSTPATVCGYETSQNDPFMGARGSLAGKPEFENPKLPIIITESPPTSVSLSTERKVSPSPLTPPPTPSTPPGADSDRASISSWSRNRRLVNEDDLFEIEAEISPLVPLIGQAEPCSDRAPIAAAVSDSSPSTACASPIKALRTAQGQPSLRRQLPAPTSLAHRGVSSLRSLGSSPNRILRTSQNASFDESETAPAATPIGKRSRSLIEHRRRSSQYRVKPLKKNRILHQDSGCSLEFYDDASNCTSMSSLYGDTSLHSVLEFGTLLSTLESAENDDTSTITSTGSLLDKNDDPCRRNKSWATNLSELFRNRKIESQTQMKFHKPPTKSHENGDLVRTSSLTSSGSWTRSASTSIRSQYSMQFDPGDQNGGNSNSSSSPVKFKGGAMRSLSLDKPRHAGAVTTPNLRSLATSSLKIKNYSGSLKAKKIEPKGNLERTVENLGILGRKAQQEENLPNLPQKLQRKEDVRKLEQKDTTFRKLDPKLPGELLQIVVEPEPILAAESHLLEPSSSKESFLPPIIEEEKSTTTKADVDPASRRSSFAPSSVCSPLVPKNGAKQKRSQASLDSSKVVHLAVPSPIPPGFGSFGFGDRKTSGSSTATSRSGRRSTDRDWHRLSWQSFTSSIYNVGRRHLRRAVDDDDESDGRDPGSSADESTSDPRKRSTSWFATLFNNPTSILHRKRKVTKAEKRARKAFRTITVIVGTFALFWSPYYIVATIYGFCQDCVPAPLFLTSYYLCYLNSSVNPFAYAFANRLFRKTFIRILRGDLRRT